LKVKDIMSKNVAYVNPKASVTEVAKLMQKHDIGAIPVCDQSGVVGIVTDRDIVVRNVAHGTNPQAITAQEVMTSNVRTVSPETEVDEASDIMANKQIRRLPVIENNKLVGILALGDIAEEEKYDFEASKALSEISEHAAPKNMDKK